jgi:uncharacterized protein
MIERQLKTDTLETLGYLPAVAILGPRQVGKTTFVKQIATQLGRSSVYLDLEYTADRDKLRQPDLYFREHKNELVILDEVQRVPDLFPLLRVMIDEHRVPGRFLLLGSASPELLRMGAETLAGRILYLEMHPFDVRELAHITPVFPHHWLQGGFPDAFLAPQARYARIWMRGFVQTYIERDLPALGLTASPVLMRNLLGMLAHLHGSILVYADLANALDVSLPTVIRYVDFLENAFLIRRLKPYFVNAGKRLVKSPKVYIRDTGLLHHLLSIDDFDGLMAHPVIGNSWEGYIIQQVIANLNDATQPYFYRTKDKAEVDLVLVKNGVVVLTAEIKFSNNPSLSRGNTVAMNDLSAPQNLIITPQADDYWLTTNWRVCNFQTMWPYLQQAGVLNQI